jgi:tetratricopeptide (TPR) repeat protein
MNWAHAFALAAWGAWGAWFVVRSASGAWAPALALRRVFTGPFPGLTAAGLAGALVRHLGTAALVAGFAAAVAGAGRPVLGLLPSSRRLSRGDYLAASAVAGWGLLALALLGLALTGLFYPWAVASAGIAGLALWAFPGPRPAIGFPSLDRPWLAPFLLVALPAVLATPLLLVPPCWVDPLIYHLAIPESLLKAHGFVMEGRNQSFHFPLSAELLNALPVMTDRDELANFVSLVPFVAGLAFAASRTRELAGPGAAGLATGLVLASASVQWLFLKGKNDLAVVGLALMAVTAEGRGLAGLSALVWGIAGGTKYNGLAFAAFAWGWHEAVRASRLGRGWRPRPGWLILAAAPILPWLAKNWYCRGDPVWPVFSRFIPGAMWDSLAAQSMHILTLPHPAVWELPGEGLRLFLSAHPALVLLVPLAFLPFARVPWPLLSAALFGAFGYAFYALTAHMEYDRMTVPMMAVMAAAPAAAAFRLFRDSPRRLALAGAAALALTAWCTTPGALLTGEAASWDLSELTGMMSRDAYYSVRLTTLHEARTRMRGVPGRGTTLLVEEARCYRWPGRIAVEEYWGRSTPWKMVDEASTTERLAARFRQMGVTHIAYNFVTELYPRECAAPFVWTDRMVALWRDFIKNRTVVEIPPRTVENTNGGYCVYRLVPPLSAPPRVIAFLPGIRTLRWAAAHPYLYSRDSWRAAELCEKLAAAYPDVAIFRMDAGFFWSEAKDGERAWRILEKDAKAGLVGDLNIALAGDAARHTGRLDEAIPLLERSLPLYPDRRALVARALMNAFLDKARILSEKGKNMEALALAEKASVAEPGNPMPRLSLSFLYYQLGRYDEAMKAVGAVLDTRPIDSKTMNVASQMYQQIEAKRQERDARRPGR